ncbi:coiled coil protein [Legionella birminghamensis]|uniref:Coiled coil protein n=1 Tax=Legionella birminghamensis TaxID=28083 RepID=A0A378IAZ8_9GAMM|nr:hypothetical protein [Legionella birminghamensis]KTC71755.1 coiled coil protein [Legionella birminghamensis]STX32408.1 coiled coil protein [Legionella birminghamensis]
MPLKIKIKNPAEVNAGISAKKERVTDIKQGTEVMLQNVEMDLNGGLADMLKAEKIDQEMYDAGIETNLIMKDDYTKALGVADRTIARYDQLMAESSGLVIIIPAATQREELSQLIKRAEALLPGSEDNGEKIFLNEIISVARGLKDTLDTGQDIAETSIPLSAKELMLWAGLTKGLDPSYEHLDKTAKDINYLLTRRSIAQTSENLLVEEKHILVNLFSKLMSIILEDDADKTTKIQHTIGLAVGSSASIERTQGFKGWINDICKSLSLPAIFTIKSESVSRTDNLRHELELAKHTNDVNEESSEQQQADDSEEPQTHSPS